MTLTRHGLSIGIEHTGSTYYLTMKAVGKLTHDDYEVITPMIDRALEGVPKPTIKALIDATELEGWEARAAWDDFRLGLKHGRDFEQIAILGNRRWQQLAAKLGSWFIAGEVRYFEELEDALQWLQG